MNIVEFLKYLALGLIQGITEPLPVSSSGHMIILNSVFGEMLTDRNMNNFQIITNFASLLAIIIYYRNIIIKIGVGSWDYVIKKEKKHKTDFLYLLYIIIATIPAGLIGLIIKIYGLEVYFTNILCAGICLFITGNLLLFIHHIAPKANKEDISLKDSIFMGSAQVIGLLPGISRSGITTSFGVSGGVRLENAFRFSFMMYIPVSIAAAALGFYELMQPQGNDIFIAGYIGAFVASLIGTYVAISFFFKMIKNKNLKYFGYYCIGVAMIVVLLIAIGIF